MQDLFTKQSFQCNRYCGECCKKLAVRVNKEDIKNIKRLGYNEEDFLERELLYKNKFILKRNKDGCVFLKKSKDGKYSCAVHRYKPKICRQYPFFGENKTIKSCLPQDMFPNVLFKFNNSNKIK